MFRVTREFEFCFGHRLMDYDGKCRQPAWAQRQGVRHARGRPLDRLGMVVDFVEIKRVIGTWIDDTLDHTLLLQKDDPLVKTLRAAGEKVLPLDDEPDDGEHGQADLRIRQDQGLPVVEVTMWETPYSYATYKGGEVVR